LCQTGLSRHLQFLTPGHSDAQGWATECPDVKNYKIWLNPVWHMMLYCCTHMATAGVKGLNDVLKVKIGPTSASVDALKNWERKSAVNSEFSCIFRVYRWQNLLGGLSPIFGRRYPRRNHVHIFQIWWGSVRGFSVGWGSNFVIPHWLWRLSLQRCRVSVWCYTK